MSQVANLDTLLAITGLNRRRMRINPLPVTDGIRVLQRNDTVLYNFALNTPELVKCECTLLLKKYGSFAWLTDPLPKAYWSKH
jgi:hypothetical protein